MTKSARLIVAVLLGFVGYVVTAELIAIGPALLAGAAIAAACWLLTASLQRADEEPLARSNALLGITAGGLLIAGLIAVMAGAPELGIALAAAAVLCTAVGVVIWLRSRPSA